MGSTVTIVDRPNVLPNDLSKIPQSPYTENPSSASVIVVNGNLNAALKAFKRRFAVSGAYREAKRHLRFEKPSTRRRAKHREAVRRTRRAAFRRSQHESVG